MSTEVLYLQTGETSARQDRWLADRIFTEGVSDVGAGQLLVTERAGGANMSVDVAPGDAIVTGDSITDQGKYQVRLTAGVNVPIEGAPAAGTRVDLVVLQVHDSTADGGDAANDGAAVAVVTGEVDAGVPAVPDSALPLAEVTVGAGVGSIFAVDIADRRTQLNAVTLDVGTQAIPLTAAERDALNDPKAGTLVLNTDQGRLEYRGAVTWDRALAASTLYGDGSDGDVTVTGSTTLTRDMHYDNLTVAAGGVLDTNGYRVMVRGTLTNDGTIRCNGRNGVNGGWAVSSYTAGAGAAGSSFGGSIGYDSANNYGAYASGYGGRAGQGGGLGFLGGAGGAGGPSGSYTYGQGGTPESTALSMPRSLPLLLFVGGITKGTLSKMWGGAGGGGGAADGNAHGGAGGSGGGLIVLTARLFAGSGTVQARGGDGGDSGSYSHGSGGGGGGGCILTASAGPAPTGWTYDVAGGQRGPLHANGGQYGTNGQPGFQAHITL